METAAAQESNDESFDGQRRELPRGVTKLLNLGFIRHFKAGILPYYHTDWNRDRRNDFPDERNRWCQATHLGRANDLQSAGAATLGGNCVGHRAGDDFENQHPMLYAIFSTRTFAMRLRSISRTVNRRPP